MKMLVNVLFSMILIACAGEQLPESKITSNTSERLIYANHPTEPEVKEPGNSQIPTDAVSSIENIKLTYLSFSGYYDFHDVTSAAEGDDVTVLRFLVENQGASALPFKDVVISMDTYDVQVGPCTLYSHSSTQTTVITISTDSWFGNNPDTGNRQEWMKFTNISYAFAPSTTTQVEVHCGLHKGASGTGNSIFVGTQYFDFGDYKPLRWTKAYTQVTAR